MAMDLYSSPISSHSNQSSSSSSSSPQRPVLFPEDPAELLLDSSCHHSLLLTMGDQGSDAGYHSGCSTSGGLSPLRSPTSSVDDSCCLSPSPLPPPPPETSSSLLLSGGLLSGGLLSGGFSSTTDIPECFTFQQQQDKQPVTSQSLSGATTTTAMSSMMMIPEEDQNQNQEVERKCSQRGRKPRSRYPGRKRESASEREKLRMRDLTKALHYLRSYLPASVAPLGQTLTKIETLRLTIRYIDHLSAQLGTSQQDLEIHSARRPTTNQTQGLHHQQQQQQQQAQSPMERIHEPRLSYIQPTHAQPSHLSSEEAFTFNNPQPISPMAKQTHAFIPQCGSPIAQGVQGFNSQYLQPSSEIQHFQAPAQAPLPNVYAPALGAFPTHAPLQAGSALDGFPSQMSPQSLHDCYQNPNAIPYAEDFCFPAQQLWVPSQQNMFYGLC